MRERTRGKGMHPRRRQFGAGRVILDAHAGVVPGFGLVFLWELPAHFRSALCLVPYGEAKKRVWEQLDAAVGIDDEPPAWAGGSSVGRCRASELLGRDRHGLIRVRVRLAGGVLGEDGHTDREPDVRRG